MCFACVRPSKEPIAIRRVLVDIVDPSGLPIHLHRAKIENVIAKVLREHRDFRESKKETALSLRIKISPTLSYFVKASGIIDNDVDLQIHLKGSTFSENSLYQTFTSLFEKYSVQRLDTLSLIELVRKELNEDGFVESDVLELISILGKRKTASSEAFLKNLLFHPNQKIGGGSLQALAKIGGPMSVEAVVQYSLRKPKEKLIDAIVAVREMGGRKAAAWLFTLSTGHPDVQVRRLASDSLRVVEERLLPEEKNMTSVSFQRPLALDGTMACQIVPSGE